MGQRLQCQLSWGSLQTEQGKSEQALAAFRNSFLSDDNLDNRDLTDTANC